MKADGFESTMSLKCQITLQVGNRKREGVGERPTEENHVHARRRLRYSKIMNYDNRLAFHNQKDKLPYISAFSPSRPPPTAHLGGPR